MERFINPSERLRWVLDEPWFHDAISDVNGFTTDLLARTLERGVELATMRARPD